MAQQLGGIHLHRGPMFAGKTSKLLRMNEEAQGLGLITRVFSHASDTRYAPNHVVSHDGKKTRCIPVTELGGVSISGCHIIFIDEGQFMPDLLQFCKYAVQSGKIVHVFGLTSDYLLREFRALTELALIANSTTDLTGVCSRCGDDANTTARITNDTERIIIGSAQYEPRCRNCHTVPSDSADNADPE